jgi:hypothetical protein
VHPRTRFMNVYGLAGTDKPALTSVLEVWVGYSSITRLWKQ